MAGVETSYTGVGVTRERGGIAMEDQDKTASALGTLIHLGAGNGARLADFGAMGVRKIVLLEPAAAAARRLDGRTTGMRDLTVRHGAIGPTQGEGVLNCWNLPRLNSRCDPAPLLPELFPGLRLKERQPVPVITPAQLVAEIGGIARPSLLVVEDPGSEMAILQAWKADGLLDRIDRIELHSPEAALYEQGTTRAELEDWLVAEGFAVTARDGEDPDWPVLHLRADHAARALAHAETQKAELVRTLAERDAALKTAQDKATQQEAALAEARTAAEARAKTLAERDAALKTAQDKATQQEAALAEARTAAEARAKVIAERDAALKTAQDKATQQEAALAEARTAAEARAKTLAERDAALKTAQDKAAQQEAALAEARTAAEARAKVIAELRGEIARLTDGLQRNQFDQRKLTQDLGLSLRARDRLEADLRDLRARHAQVLAVSQQQDELLRQLTPRLQRAATELQALSAGAPHAPRLRRFTAQAPAAVPPAPSPAPQPKRPAAGARKGRKG